VPGRRGLWFCTLLAVVGAALGLPVAAHEFALTDVVAILKTNGTFQVDMGVDLDALALGVSPSVDDAEMVAQLESLSAAEFEAGLEQARDTLLRRVRITFDGVEPPLEVSFPEMGTDMTDSAEIPTVLGITARFTGRIPEGAESFGFRASRAWRTLHLTILDQSTAGGLRVPLVGGEDSPPYTIGTPAAGAASGGVAWRYVALGFEHILPRGLDHILFVLGLFLLSTRFRPLLWQITAFTVAHSVTLALSMYGLVSLPSRLVESLIALSIAYVAVENLVTSELKPWRPLLVFGFGLLHGLGFADVLRELGLPQGDYATALISFNVGVELGQLGVVAIAWLTVGWFRERTWYRARIVMPVSAAIALTGLYWFIQRAWG